MKKISLLILLSAITFITYSQNTNSELLKKLVEKEILTQSEADEIIKESEPAPEIKSSVNPTFDKVREAFNTPFLKFGGYGLLTYKYHDVARIKHDVKARALFLHMGGKLPYDIGYFVMAEFTDPFLYEFYAEWTPSTRFNFRIGQYKVPFTLENPISLTNLETISNARSISSLAGMSDDVMKKQNGRNNAGRDMGLQISGSLIPLGNHNLLEYSLGLFQGSGMSSSEKNNSKDFAGTLLLQPVKGFRIGGGAYFGEATYSVGEETAESDHVRNRWVISTDYNSERLYGRAEWIHGKDGIIDREGLYGTLLYYFIPKKLNAVGKVDYYNKNKKYNTEAIDYTVGLNYYFYPQCRVQVNYTYSDYSKNWDADNSNTLQAQLQIVF